MLNSITCILNRIWYFILYHYLGFKGMAEDILNRKHNKIELKDKTGYVAVITGGARGIGSQLVKLLMQCDMHVIIGCRNVEAGNKLFSEIRKSGIEKGSLTVLRLDLKSLASVRSFAQEIIKRNDKIDLLVNNAGIMFVPYSETEDGFESHFAVNYLSHFLLTQLLLPVLKNASSSTAPRIVNVSSCAHELAPHIDFNDICLKKNYIEYVAYSQSKLLQIMFTKALDRRLKEAGSSVRVFAVHPGVVNTDIFEGTFVKLVFPWFLNWFCKSPIKGAVSVVYACIADELEDKSGTYSSNCRVVNCIEYANNVDVQEKLYEISLDYVKEFLN